MHSIPRNDKSLLVFPRLLKMKLDQKNSPSSALLVIIPTTVIKSSFPAQDPPIRPPCSAAPHHREYYHRSTLNNNQLCLHFFRAVLRIRKVMITEDPILSVSIPRTSLLELITEDQWSVSCNVLIALRLPFPFHPYNPYVSCIDRSWDDSKTT